MPGAMITVSQTVNGLSGDSYRALFRDLSVSDGVGVDMGELDLSGMTTDNAKYLTQPNSALSGPESFASNQELLLFSGSVGLDDNISGGSLRELELSVDGLSLLYAVLDGERHAISANAGKYYIDGVSGAELPLDLSIYARALYDDTDARLTVTAYVNADGFDSDILPAQPVCDITVAAPSVTISGPEYACDILIPVSGTAAPDMALLLYDGDIVVGQAQADAEGKWSAELPLYGTQPAVVTRHQLKAVSEDGGQSSPPLTLLHHPDYPQLLSQSLSVDGRSYVPGQIYTWDDAGKTYTLQAEFKNYANLREPGERGGGFGTPVVFCVSTHDGRVHYVEAALAETSGNIGVYEAEFENYYAVTGLSVLYGPKEESYGSGADTTYIAPEVTLDYPALAPAWEAALAELGKIDGGTYKELQGEVMAVIKDAQPDAYIYMYTAKAAAPVDINAFVSADQWFAELVAGKASGTGHTLDRQLSEAQFAAELAKTDVYGEYYHVNVDDGTTPKYDFYWRIVGDSQADVFGMQCLLVDYSGSLSTVDSDKTQYFQECTAYVYNGSGAAPSPAQQQVQPLLRSSRSVGYEQAYPHDMGVGSTADRYSSYGDANYGSTVVTENDYTSSPGTIVGGSIDATGAFLGGLDWAGRTKFFTNPGGGLTALGIGWTGVNGCLQDQSYMQMRHGMQRYLYGPCYNKLNEQQKLIVQSKVSAFENTCRTAEAANMTATFGSMLSSAAGMLHPGAAAGRG